MGGTPPGEPATGSRTTGAGGLARSPRSLVAMSTNRNPGTRLGGIVLTAVLAALSVGCGGGADQSVGTDTTTTTIVSVPALDYPHYSDPGLPISIGLSRRFAVVLPSDPASGWHWTSEPVDQALLAPLGSEFRDDPDLLASIPPPTTTTTTVSPFASGPFGTSTTVSAEPAVEGTMPAPLVQVISFAARGLGSTTVSFRYNRIGSADEDSVMTATFIVTIVPDTTLPGTSVPVPLP